MGSLAVVHLPSWSERRELVGDDLGAKAAEIAQLAAPGLMAGVVVAALLGLLWALSWIFLARRLAAGLGANRRFRVVLRLPANLQVQARMIVDGICFGSRTNDEW